METNWERMASKSALAGKQDVASSNTDSKKIVNNMKEVISSTNKKERQQYRRKKENIKKLEPEITDISSVMNETLVIVSPNVSLEESKGNKIPLKENSTQSSAGKEVKKRTRKSKNDSISNAKSPTKMMSIRDHFSPKPKVNTGSDPENSSDNLEQNKPSQKLNAFEVMMNARNKSIGSNTPGKEPEKNEVDAGSSDSKMISVKRKLILEDWAAKKGATKRKLDDVAQEEYIENELQKRAKRLKRMLVPGVDSTATKINSKSTPRSRLSLKRKEKRNSPHSEREDSKESQSESKKKTKKEKKVKTTTKKRARRLSSTETVDLNNLDNGRNEEIEFVSQLSSPLKKRDSLLGYFQKVVSPTSTNIEDTNENILENKKDKKEKVKKQECEESLPKSKKQKNSKLNRTPSLDLDTPKCSSIPERSDSGRPKRSCAGKARYDYDLENSPKKDDDVTEEKPKRAYRKNALKKTSTPDVVKTESEEEQDTAPCEIVIDLDTSMDESFSKSVNVPMNVPMKLAPVFIKAVPKPSPDPRLVKARQEFLISGVPEKMRLEMEKQRQFEQAYEAAVEYFPKISHVHQLDTVDNDCFTGIDWEKCKLTLRDISESPPSKKLKIKKRKSAKMNLLENPSVQILLPLQKLQEIEEKRLFVKQLKTKYEKFPTFRCYNQLREKYKSFSAKDSDLDTQQLTESFVVTKSARRSKQKSKVNSDQEEDKPPPSAPNGELLFTEKYKPINSEQVLVNLAPVSALREFLSLWQVGRTAKHDDYYDSESANDSISNSAGICNFVVLLGPSSSGKTNAVFALANELNFNVLEINAGMKRTGKKLLQELHEATQSHQIRQDNAKSNFIKQSLSGLKKKQTDLNDSNSSLEQNNSEKKSLILVEDADIVFEQDSGFVDAIYQLSASAKRPVIITANNPNCQHLQRLMNQHVIHFSSPNVLNISKFLSILSLIENCPIDLNDIVSLYLYNHRDMRKTLLEMQFFIQSGGDRARKKSKNVIPHFFATSPKRLSEERENSNNDDQDEICDTKIGKCPKIYTHNTLFEFYTICQNIDRRIPFPINYSILRENLPEIFKVSQKLPKIQTRRISPGKRKNIEISGNVFDSLKDFYENISVASYITLGDDSGDSCCPSLSDDISHYLVEESLKVNLEVGTVAYNLFSKDPERTTLASNISSNIIRTQRSLALEYEPCLRSICRSEKSRSQMERRGSRFYHYLRNTCTNLSSFATEVFESSCSVLMDEKVPI